MEDERMPGYERVLRRLTFAGFIGLLIGLTAFAYALSLLFRECVR